MAESTRICDKAELPDAGKAKEFEVNGRTVCVANVAGRLCAMDNVCVHRGGPLGQGSVERGNIVCPWHGWEFDPESGSAIHNPQHKIAVYRIRVEGNDVLLAPTPGDRAGQDQGAGEDQQE